jgi:hypothetical protein
MRDYRCNYVRNTPHISPVGGAVKLRIFGRWLVFGCVFGCLGFVELAIATHRILLSLLLGVAIGIGSGVLAGALFLLLIQIFKPELEPRQPRSERRLPLIRLVEIVLVVLLASGSGIARTAGAPSYVFVPMVVLATVVLFGARAIERRDSSAGSRRLPPTSARPPPGWWWDEESATFRPPRRSS